MAADSSQPNIANFFSAFQALLADSLLNPAAFDAASAALSALTQAVLATPTLDITKTLANTVIYVCERASTASPMDSPFLFWALCRLLE